MVKKRFFAEDTRHVFTLSHVEAQLLKQSITIIMSVAVKCGG